MPSENSPVWFITGCSTGFGRELAKQVLARGWRAVVTARDKARLDDLVADTGDRALACDLDLADQDQIVSAAKAAIARFGRVDVLVNNAGYGYLTTAEEGEDAEIRALFEANVFGLFSLTREILPSMRRQRKGHVINFSSIAGHVGNLGSAYYAATKHAVEGFSKSLLAECGPLGIRVTCVAPGPFRTDWGGRSLKTTQSRIADYADTTSARIAGTISGSGKQPGDPVRAAAAIISLAEAPNPPANIALGARAYAVITEQLRRELGEIEAWREVGVETDFPS